MQDVLDDLYELKESDRCRVMHAALRNLQAHAEANGSVTSEDIDEFLRLAAQGYWPAEKSR